MERTEAIKLGLRQYTTGRTCKNGHNSYRYTTTGACKDCVHPTLPKVEKPIEHFELVELRTRVFAKDTLIADKLVYFAAMLRYPTITRATVTQRGKSSGHSSGTSVRHYLVHPNDYDALLKALLDLFSKSNGPVDMSHILGRVAAIKHEEIDAEQDKFWNTDPTN